MHFLEKRLVVFFNSNPIPKSLSWVCYKQHGPDNVTVIVRVDQKIETECDRLQFHFTVLLQQHFLAVCR